MSGICPKCMESLNSDGSCPNCGEPDQKAEQPQHCLPVGTVLGSGRYLVGKVIGQGGFGITYIGRDQTLDMRVAIKEYYPAPYVNRNSQDSHALIPVNDKARARMQKGRARFLEEARVLAKFHSSPGVVDVRDYFEQNGTAYIVMDYLDGVTLKTYLENTTLDADRAFTLIAPILDDLEQIHAEQVIHCDISPDNIMLRQDGTLCLMDFGGVHDMAYSGDQSKTIVLKSGYAPEEQYRSKGKIGPWTDVYSLCATVYRAITGVDPEESLQRVIADEMKWPSEMGLGITAAQEAVLKKGLAPLHADRYQSITEMKDDLRQIEEARRTAASDAGDEASGESVDAQQTHADSATAASAAASGVVDAEAAKADEASSEGIAELGKTETSEQDQIEDSAHVSQGKKRLGSRKLAACLAVAVCAIGALALALFLLAPAYTVTFETNGGSAVSATEVSRIGALDSPEAPNRHGYGFAGWYLDAALQNKADFPLKPQSDVTLYAAWNKTLASYSVSYLDAADDSEVAPAKTIAEANVGSTVKEKAPAVDGYSIASEENAKLVVTEDESKNRIVFKYRKLVSYVVYYRDQGTKAEVLKAKQVDGAIEGEPIEEGAPDVKGYTLKSEKTLKLTPVRNAEESVLTFYYEKIPQEPQYVYVPSGGGSSGGGGGSSSSNDVDWVN